MAIKTFILALCLVATQLYATDFGDIPASTNVSTLWVPPSRTLTIGGSTLDLSANRTWTATTILDSLSSTQGTVLYRGASNWTALSPSTDGNVLTTHGASANPTWTTPTTVSPAALTKTDDTNVTLTLGGTPATSLLHATSLTLGWTGTLGISRGGTGAATVSAQTVFGNNTGSTAAPSFSSAPQFLKIGNLTGNGFVKTGSGDGTLSVDTSTYLTSTSISDTAYGSSWNGVTTVAPSKNAIYDELHLIDTADDGSIVNAGTGFRIGGAAASGKILVGNGTNYVASTPTFPNASATSGKVIKSDGTNWVASTETYAAPGTSGNVLTSDGTNWTSAAPTGGGGTTVKVSGSNFTTTSTGLVSITGLSQAVTNGDLLEVDILLKLQSTSTAGINVGFLMTGSASGVPSCWMLGQAATGTLTSGLISATGSALATTVASTANTDSVVSIKGVFTVTASGGNLQVAVAKLTSGTATVYIGSRFTLTKLN